MEISTGLGKSQKETNRARALMLKNLRTIYVLETRQHTLTRLLENAERCLSLLVVELP